MGKSKLTEGAKTRSQTALDLAGIHGDVQSIESIMEGQFEKLSDLDTIFSATEQRLQSTLPKFFGENKVLVNNPAGSTEPLASSPFRHPMGTVDRLPPPSLSPSVPDVPVDGRIEPLPSSGLSLHAVYHTMGLATSSRDPARGKAPLLPNPQVGVEVGPGSGSCDPNRVHFESFKSVDPAIQIGPGSAFNPGHQHLQPTVGLSPLGHEQPIQPIISDTVQDRLIGVTSQIFNKALMEPSLCETYANICSLLVDVLPCFIQGNEKITFKRLLLNLCQMEFEREQEANHIDEKRIESQRRKLGNIRFIGELYKKRMLTERIIHECIKKLLGNYENPDEEDVEGLCVLMSTVGDMMDHPIAKVSMDAYFERIGKLSNSKKVSYRVRVMLRDVIDLRRNEWQKRRKLDWTKWIEELNRDGDRQQQAQSCLWGSPMPCLVLGVSLLLAFLVSGFLKSLWTRVV